MRIVFMGSPAEVVSPLSYLINLKDPKFQVVGVVSQPARPVGRGGHVQDPPVAICAKEQGITCLQPESAKAADFLAALRELAPDVIVTAAYGQILSDDFLKIPTRGTINIHPSKLPQYRGATPVPAALLDGHTQTAVTILFTVKKLDAGNLILAKSFDIGSHEKSGELTARLFNASGPLLIEALNKLLDSKYEGVPQDDSAATFCKKIDKESGEVDWTQSADIISRRFRAYDPWPGTWTYLGDKRIAITDLSIAADKSALGEPGCATWDKPSKALLVDTGSGVIQINRVKPAGGKDMDAAGFWNGVKDKSRAKFQKGPQSP